MKKILSILIVVLMVLFVFNTTAFAFETNLDKITTEVEITNIKIEQMIDKAKLDAQRVLDRYSDSEKIDDMIQKIIDKLIDETNKISNKTIEKAEKLGIHVECYYEEVVIGGQPVLIDPLRIIGS